MDGNEDHDSGMGLAEFLDFDPDRDRGGGGDWLKPWKKQKQIDIWLHTASGIRGVWGHQFIIDVEVDEKNDKGEKTGRKANKLLWPRFVSPDLASIHANQYFRDGDQLRELFNKDRAGKLIGGSNATAFMTDPFLILREYLYHAIAQKLLDPDAAVFEWVNHKERGELITHTAGELSRQVKRGFKNRGHSLDTKLEYIFVVVNHERPGDGPKVTRETKLLGDNMRAEIKRQIESKGVEEGDPFKLPYCFRWKFDADASSPMKSYEAFRVDKNVCTQEIWIAIGGAPDPEQGESWDIVEAPDTAQYARVNDGDMDKIAQAFEQAAQIELPLEAIFSSDWEVRRRVVTGEILRQSASRVQTQSAQTQSVARPNPGAAPGAVRPGAARAATPATTPAATRPVSTAAAPAAASSPAPAAAAPSGPQPRRKKKEEPAPAPAPREPEVERIPCEDCGHPMLPTEAKCPKCGAEYDIGETVVEPEPPAPKAQPSAPSGAKRPQAKSAEEQAEANEIAEKKCIACGSQKLVKVTREDGTSSLKCENCNVDQGDDIPF